MLRECSVLFAKHRADLFSILKAFADIGGYRLEWQLLNTSWFLPQNRERIYLVGRLAERCTGSVFPIGEVDCENGEVRKDTGYTVGAIVRGYSNPSITTRYVMESLDGKDS